MYLVLEKDDGDIIVLRILEIQSAMSTLARGKFCYSNWDSIRKELVKFGQFEKRQES